MKKTPTTHILFVLLGLFLLSWTACQPATTGLEESASSLAMAEQAQPNPVLALEQIDTISIKMEEYSRRIFARKGQLAPASFSADEEHALRAWWDSLPGPIQQKIKNKELNVEIASEIRTDDERKINTVRTDAHIEQAGSALKRIIGEPAEVTYTVNTMVVASEGGIYTADDEFSTAISVREKKAVRLSEYTQQIFLHENELSHENFHTLQYWWRTLPFELQEKVRDNRLQVEVSCHSIDPSSIDSRPSSTLGEGAAEQADIIADLLHGYIGVRKVGNKTYNIAEVVTSAYIEKHNASNAKFPTERYIEISLVRPERAGAVIN